MELREDECTVLITIRDLGGRATVRQLVEKTGLPDATVMRAAIELQKQMFASITEEKRTDLSLSEEGKIHAKRGLPERRLLEALRRLGGEASLDQVAEEADLEEQFVPVASGWIQRKGWALLNADTKELQALEGAREGHDERLLRQLSKSGHLTAEELGSTLREVTRTLKRRKLLKAEERTKRTVAITETGLATLDQGVRVTPAEVSQLTPELMTSGEWRKARLRKYNIDAPGRKVFPGKKHPYSQFVDEVKRKLVTLGFREMTGPIVETSFFNFDSLYTPQDHPAREAQGIYFVKKPKYGNLGPYRPELSKVKKTHEDGWKTNSEGWGYKYSLREAKRLVLRGHGTCLSVRTLLNKDLEVPGRYFSIARCFRPDVPDKTHLTEFNQVEGIVVDESLTLRDLLGVLEKFAIEIAGADDVRFKPDYFPFTEPSVELNAYRKGYGWIEFGGSGIFRPEVTLPLNIHVPVIAWGLGIDRLFMMKAGIRDIRQIFTQDLSWIRRKEAILSPR